MRFFVLFILGLILGFWQPSFAQFVLPEKQLLADSGITHIRIFKQSFGELKRDRDWQVSPNDTFTESLYYDIRLDTEAFYLQDFHYQHGKLFTHRSWVYNDTGLILASIIDYPNMPGMSRRSIVHFDSNGEFTTLKWGAHNRNQVTKGNQMGIMLYDIFYGENDSTVIVQDISEFKRTSSYYYQGKCSSIHRWEWTMENGKPIKYTESKKSYPFDKKEQGVKESTSFNVKEDGTLILFGWYSDNIDYTRISLSNWLQKVDPIRFAGPPMVLDSFPEYSMVMFEPAFTSISPAYRLRFEYLKE